MKSSILSSVKGRIFIILIAGVLVIIAALFLFTPKTQAATNQPIAFNHQVMVQLGVNCLFCHTDARRSPAAGIPSMERCMGCHRSVDPTNPIIKQVADYYNSGTPIPWQRVNQLPRFVFFDHQVHINNGQNCEKCHGDVGHMTVDKPVLTMDMGWCLSCHEQQPNGKQLQDCVVCHR
jgi:hypothetical protein